MKKVETKDLLQKIMAQVSREGFAHLYPDHQTNEIEEMLLEKGYVVTKSRCPVLLRERLTVTSH